MKLKTILAPALAAVMTVSVLAATAAAATAKDAQQETTQAQTQTEERQKPNGKKEKVEAPENAVGKDAAKEAALQDAGLTAEQAGKVKARISETKDDTVVYKVRFTANDKWYSYTIDALTGEVTDRTEQSAEEHAAAKENARIGNGETADASGNGLFSGKKNGKRTTSDDADAAENEKTSGQTERTRGEKAGTGSGVAAKNGTAFEKPIRTQGKGGRSTADAADQTEPSAAG